MSAQVSELKIRNVPIRLHRAGYGPTVLFLAGRQYGYEAAADQLGWACPIYVAETDERARKEAGRAVETLFNDFLRQSSEMLMPPGYTSIGSMKNFISMRRDWGAARSPPTASSRAASR